MLLCMHQDKALGDTQAACPTFFDDEWRCPTYVEVSSRTAVSVHDALHVHKSTMICNASSFVSEFLCGPCTHSHPGHLGHLLKVASKTGREQGPVSARLDGRVQHGWPRSIEQIGHGTPGAEKLGYAADHVALFLQDT